MDPEEREALIDEGMDPDDPAVIEALELVRWELSMLCDTWAAGHREPGRRDPPTGRAHHVDRQI